MAQLDGDHLVVEGDQTDCAIFHISDPQNTAFTVPSYHSKNLCLGIATSTALNGNAAFWTTSQTPGIPAYQLSAYHVSFGPDVVGVVFATTTLSREPSCLNLIPNHRLVLILNKDKKIDLHDQYSGGFVQMIALPNIDSLEVLPSSISKKLVLDQIRGGRLFSYGVKNPVTSDHRFEVVLFKPVCGVPNCFLCDTAPLTICELCELNYFLKDDASPHQCLDAPDIPSGYGKVSGAPVPKISICSDSNCLQCIADHTYCKTCSAGMTPDMTGGRLWSSRDWRRSRGGIRCRIRPGTRVCVTCSVFGIKLL